MVIQPSVLAVRLLHLDWRRAHAVTSPGPQCPTPPVPVFHASARQLLIAEPRARRDRVAARRGCRRPNDEPGNHLKALAHPLSAPPLSCPGDQRPGGASREHRAADRPLRADDARRGPAQAARPTGAACSRCSPGGCPNGRRYGVVAGTGRLLDALERFRFGDAELDFLREQGIADAPTLDWLAGYRFGGDIGGYAEGDCYFPGSPMLVVEGTFAEAVHAGDARAVGLQPRLRDRVRRRPDGHRRRRAAAASRWARAARTSGPPCQPPGPRTSPASPRPPTSGRAEYGVPTIGTSAHAFTLLHDDESSGVRRPGRRARARDHAAGRHLRRRRASVPRSRWPGPSSARSGSTGATSLRSRAGAGAARRLGATEDAHHRHRRPGRDAIAAPGRPRRPTPTGSGRRWSPGRARPPPALVYKLVARAEDDRTWRCARWRSARSASRRAAAASGPPASWTTLGARPPSWSPTSRILDGRSAGPGAAAAAGPGRRRSSGGSPLAAARDRHQPGGGRTPPARLSAIAWLPGHSHRVRAGPAMNPHDERRPGPVQHWPDASQR